MLRVTPVYGSRSSNESTCDGASPLGSCTLVEYADVRVLINTGGPIDDSNFQDLPDHDCLLVTDSTLEHMGSLPLYCSSRLKKKKMQKNKNSNNRTKSGKLRQKQLLQQDDEDADKEETSPPIYATFPTVKMGQMALYDYHANVCLDGGCPAFTLEEMDQAFSQLQTIKYAQTILLPQPTNTKNISSNKISSSNKQKQQKPRLSITAHRAGHVVGGAFYVLQRLQDETVVVITSTYHIAKELHLDSSTLLKYGASPDVLITRPGGPAMTWLSQLYSSTSARKKPKLAAPLVTQSERNLIEHVLSVLRRDGNVLLPVDASGRVLELALCLSQHWDRHRLQGAYNFIWLGPMVVNTVEFCRSQLEWMAAALGTQFDSPGGRSGGHPYAFKGGVPHCVTTISQVEAIIASSNGNPTCVMASGLSLEHGPARDLLLKWADNDNNAILFTDSSQCHVRPWRQKQLMQQQLLRQQQMQQRSNIVADQTIDANNIATNNATPSGVDGSTTTGVTANMDVDGVNAAMTASTNNPAAMGTSAVTATASTAATTATDHQDTTAATAATSHHHAVDDTLAGTAILEDDPQGGVSEYTTSYQLLRHWCAAQWEDREMEDSVLVDVLVPHRAPLSGRELQVFLEQEEAARLSKRKLEEERAMLREVELAKGRLRLGEEDKTTSTTSGTASSSSTGVGGDSSKSNISGSTTAVGTSSGMKSTLTTRPKKKSRFDSSLFLKFSKPLYLTFEVREEAVGVGQTDSTAKFGIGESVGSSEVLEDDYGIAVIPEHFIDIVTGVDPSKFAGGSGRIGDEVLRRGFGFGIVDSGTGKKNKSSKNKRGGQDGDDLDDGADDEIDEQGLEAADLSEGRSIIRGRNGRPPTKVTTVPRRLQVFAEISYIPLEGRVDSRAARQSVRALQPRQVVVLGGTIQKVDRNGEDGDERNTNNEKANDDDGVAKNEMKAVDEVTVLAEAAQSFATANRVVPTPSDMETVELEVGHAAYSVRLIDTPYMTKEEKEQEEEPPEPIEPYEAKLGACSVSLLDYVATGQKVAVDGSIVLAPRWASSSSSSRSVYLSDGEVLLTDLRSELIAQGKKAEYSAHTGYSQLVVNGKIVVKKDQDSGKIDVEGPLCEDFFAVRSVVCAQYVTL